MGKITGKLKEILREMARLDRSPESMAMACAIGLAIGISPYVGLHTYMAIAASAIFKLPVYQLVLSSHAVNVFTMPFVYAFTTKVGMWMLGIDLVIDFDWRHATLRQVLGVGRQLLLPFFLGSHMVAVLAAFPAYFLTRGLLRGYRKRRLQRQESDV